MKKLLPPKPEKEPSESTVRPAPQPSPPPKPKPSAEDNKRALHLAARLVMLASSSSEGEAAAAAVKACKLIREHDLKLLTPESYEILKRLRERLTRKQDGGFAVPGEMATMTVRHGGFSCLDCGVEIRVGERVWFRSGVGMVHAMKCDPGRLL